MPMSAKISCWRDCCSARLNFNGDSGACGVRKRVRSEPNGSRIRSSMMQMNRRFFLHRGALAVAGTTAMPSFLMRSVLAQAPAAPGQRLVVIFQRGAADGLNVVVPYREKNYYKMRPTIAIPQNQVIDLDGFFGLHPSLAAFQPLYQQGHLAIVHACGSPDMSRSHFDAQDYMESGTPGLKNTSDGWLNRALQAEDLLHRCAGTC